MQLAYIFRPVNRQSLRDALTGKVAERCILVVGARFANLRQKLKDGIESNVSHARGGAHAVAFNDGVDNLRLFVAVQSVHEPNVCLSDQEVKSYVDFLGDPFNCKQEIVNSVFKFIFGLRSLFVRKNYASLGSFFFYVYVLMFAFIFFPRFTHSAALAAERERNSCTLQVTQLSEAPFPCLIYIGRIALPVNVIQKGGQIIIQGAPASFASVEPVQPEGAEHTNSASDQTTNKTREQADRKGIFQPAPRFAHILFLLVFCVVFGVMFISMLIVSYAALYGRLADFIPWKWLRALHVPRWLWDTTEHPFEYFENYEKYRRSQQ